MKGLLGILKSSKKRTKNSIQLLWYLRLTCFCSFFGRIWRHQQDISKLGDLKNGTGRQKGVPKGADDPICIRKLVLVIIKILAHHQEILIDNFENVDIIFQKIIHGIKRNLCNGPMCWCHQGSSSQVWKSISCWLEIDYPSSSAVGSQKISNLDPNDVE